MTAMDTPVERSAPKRFSSHDGTTQTKRIVVKKDKTNPRRIAYILLFLFASPDSWPLFIAGLVLVSIAIALHAWAAGYLARAGYVERETVLTVAGPYKHNRNPYYLAHMTMDFGMFCLAGLPLYYLVYFPIIFAVYRRWVLDEEPFLEKEFGEDYQRFKASVPRWGYRLTAAKNLGKDQAFSWETFRINREKKRALSHIITMLVLGTFFFTGNPFTEVELMVKVTWVAGVAFWLLIHDIQPLDVSRISPAWFIMSVLITGITLAVVILMPVWEPWSIVSQWIALGVAMLVAMLVTVQSFPAYSRKTGKLPEEIYIRPLLQWYLLGLTIGLLSLRLGGIWIATAIPVLFWSLELAGVVRTRTLPQHMITGIMLLILYSVLVAQALYRIVT
jgi:hypothetical protein